MRKSLLYSTLVSGTALLISTITQAQDRFAYAISDVNQNTAGWTVLRKLNLQTGVYSDALFNGVDSKGAAYDAISRKQVANTSAGVANYSPTPFSTGVAAIAYDKKNNRLYYMPMFIDQLRYID